MTEFELLCYLHKPRTLLCLEKYMGVSRKGAQIVTHRLNRKGFIDVENPRSPNVVYKVSSEGERIFKQLDNLRFRA
jgi:hypothetical protein